MIKLLIALGTVLTIFFYLCFIRSVGIVNQKYDELVYEKFFKEDERESEGCRKDSVKAIPERT